MRIMVYGGSFDPPHLGHVLAAAGAVQQQGPDKLLVIPDFEAPHKQMADNGAPPEERLALARFAFAAVPGAEVSDIEIRRGGKSYTSDTLRALMEAYPGAELTLLMGTDMLLSFEQWYEAEWMLKNITLAVFPREDGDGPLIRERAASLAGRYGAHVAEIALKARPVSSTEVRRALRERAGSGYLTPETYAYIIQKRLYGAKPELAWLRRQAQMLLKPRRVPHVLGCEQEAVRLAERWGADPGDAAEAAILHDITKKLELKEQLILCEKYGIITDTMERASTKLLHAKTGAALARDLFGVPDAIYQAIRWHTTGGPDMTLLEKVIYLADYIEPTRDFSGVDALRRLAYENLDKALVLGFKMSLEDIISYKEVPHIHTVLALRWYEERIEQS